MSFIIRFSVILLLLLGTNGAKYMKTLDDEEIFKPCKGDEDNFVTSIFDTSNITFESVSDDEVIVNGYFKSIADIKPSDTLWVSIEILKEARGEYVVPMFGIKRNDFCKSAFSPTEVWYTFSKTFEKKYQICPNVNGTIYGISNWSTKSDDINLPDSSLSGGYRGIFRGGVNGNPDVTVCVLVDFHVFLLGI